MGEFHAKISEKYRSLGVELTPGASRFIMSLAASRAQKNDLCRRVGQDVMRSSQ